MNQSDIRSLLLRLRCQAIEKGIENLGSHQLDAHLSLAYACNQPPEPWEIYRVPFIHLMPCTEFFKNHSFEIQELIRPHATWKLLHEHAVEKLALETKITKVERKAYGYPGNLSYYDFQIQQWITVDVPKVRWFDSRDITRESINQTKDEFCTRVDARLAKLRKNALKNPTQKKLDEQFSYEYYVNNQFQANLKTFEADKKIAKYWLEKLETTRDFRKTLFTIIRQAENNVRAAHSIPAVGESWVSETELLYRVRELFPNIEIFAHGQPRWLGRQHLDIWIPSLSIAIEYQGVQHYQAVEFFGGEDGFVRTQERDQRKRNLCLKNGVHLIEVAYDTELSDTLLKKLVLRI